jgi:hypothetical protein
LGGTVPLKPAAANRWKVKMKAMIRGGVARNDLIIEILPLHLSVKTGRIVGQSR